VGILTQGGMNTPALVIESGSEENSQDELDLREAAETHGAPLAKKRGEK
jgi:hypothetical protein